MKKLNVYLARLALVAALMLPWTLAEAVENFKKFGVIPANVTNSAQAPLDEVPDPKTDFACEQNDVDRAHDSVEAVFVWEDPEPQFHVWATVDHGYWTDWAWWLTPATLACRVNPAWRIGAVPNTTGTTCSTPCSRTSVNRSPLRK